MSDGDERRNVLVLGLIISLVGGVALHGHRLNQDCWLCPLKGWVFLGGSALIGALAACYWDD